VNVVIGESDVGNDPSRLEGDKEKQHYPNLPTITGERTDTKKKKKWKKNSKNRN